MKRLSISYIVRPPNLEEYEVASKAELIQTLLESDLKDYFLSDYYEHKECLYNDEDFHEWVWEHGMCLAVEKGYVIIPVVR